MFIREWHTVLRKMFMALGVDEKAATEDTCRNDYLISEHCFEAVKNHFEHTK